MHGRLQPLGRLHSGAWHRGRERIALLHARASPPARPTRASSLSLSLTRCIFNPPPPPSSQIFSIFLMLASSLFVGLIIGEVSPPPPPPI
jgi:hypothetical protein